MAVETAGGIAGGTTRLAQQGTWWQESRQGGKAGGTAARGDESAGGTARVWQDQGGTQGDTRIEGHWRHTKHRALPWLASASSILAPRKLHVRTCGLTLLPGLG